jgi:hypothetical protein
MEPLLTKAQMRRLTRVHAELDKLLKEVVQQPPRISNNIQERSQLALCLARCRVAEVIRGSP